MPGPMATNRLHKAPATSKHESRHMRRVRRMQESRTASHLAVRGAMSGFHAPGSENLRKRGPGSAWVKK